MWGSAWPAPQKTAPSAKKHKTKPQKEELHMNQVLRQLGGKIRHFDGAMGTMLQERGLLPGESPTGPIWRPGRIS